MWTNPQFFADLLTSIKKSLMESFINFAVFWDYLLHPEQVLMKIQTTNWSLCKLAIFLGLKINAWLNLSHTKSVKILEENVTFKIWPGPKSYGTKKFLLKTIKSDVKKFTMVYTEYIIHQLKITPFLLRNKKISTKTYSK